MWSPEGFLYTHGKVSAQDSVRTAPVPCFNSAAAFPNHASENTAKSAGADTLGSHEILRILRIVKSWNDSALVIISLRK